MQFEFRKLILLALASFCSSLEVKSVPGLNATVNFKQFSGFLRASPTRYFFFWFVESQTNPAVAPLVTWQNGGPGCSSMMGMLEELGPFLFEDRHSHNFKLNPYAWNREANMLFIETPAGTGYSYSTDFDISNGDEQIADEHYEALKDFFRQFPQYKRHDFFLTGESYCGTYLPMFATRIIDGLADFPLNFKGYAIGNGCTDDDLNVGSTARFQYYHGLIDQALWQLIETACCDGCASNCSFDKVPPGFCRYNVDEISSGAWLAGINTYDIYRDCDNPPVYNSQRFAHIAGLAPPHVLERYKQTHYLKAADLPTPKQTVYQVADVIADPLPECNDGTRLTAYLNREDVRTALHIPDHVHEWLHCSDPVAQTYKRQVTDKSAHVLKAVRAGVRVLLYHGDTDMACSFQLGQEFSKRLGLPLVAAKRVWRTTDQIAGFVTQYKGLDFLTVKGGGHLLPEWKPVESWHMINAFLKNIPY